jgi:Domain of unknown function (DUF4383)
MVKTAAVLFGIVFILIGILGFVPGITTNEMLLGIFHVNAAHNVVHLLSGAVALFAGMTSFGASRMYFRIFGVIYGLVAILGLMNMGQHTMLLGLISNNDADTFLHIAIAAVSLLLGFMPARAETV